MEEITVKQNEAGQRMEKLLTKYLDLAPKSFLYKMLRKKNILLNNKKASGAESLVLGDKIQIYLAANTIEKFRKPLGTFLVNMPLSILYEDEDVCIINKPAGVLSQRANASDISLVDGFISHLLEEKYLIEEDLQTFKPGLCNRLDRNTSGLVVGGKSLVGLQKMNLAFRERTLEKYYRTIVVGEIKEKKQIEGYLLKDEKTNKVTIYKEEKQNSLYIKTEYTPIFSRSGFTFLEIHLLTGRTHQIRAHLSSIAHPLIGDYKYGDTRINNLFKKNYGLSHHLLHSYRLEMPIFQELPNLSKKIFVAKLPKQFKIIVEELENGNLEF